MSSKVLLPKKVAEALTHLKLECGSQGILAGVLGSANTRPFEILKKYIEPIGGFEVLLEVLVNGFEVEETPEDKIRKIFNSPPNGSNQHSYAAGVVDTLNALNIIIEGVSTE